MLQSGTESGLFCADKAYKPLCITEENKAQKKVLLGKKKRLKSRNKQEITTFTHTCCLAVAGN